MKRRFLLRRTSLIQSRTCHSLVLDLGLGVSPMRRRDFISLLGGAADPPPLKWSDLRYVFDIQEDCNGKEALQARRDRREAAPGRCSGLAVPGHDGGDPADRCARGDLLSLASRVWRAED